GNREGIGEAMKPVAAFMFLVMTCVAVVRGVYQMAMPAELPLSTHIPAGPLLYLEAKDFSSILAQWNSSAEKERWVTSASYEVFSRSRLFLRLKEASDQFAAAGGLPPGMNFLKQVTGDRS